MRFLADLRRELAARGIRGRLAERIEAELADHLACDPAARLGDPAEIAERFAAELRVVRSRRAVWETFAALAVCAALLGVAERHPAGGASWAGLVVAVCAQIAFVAGCLALLRGVRARTAGDFHLAQRRAAVALVAGAGVAAGMAGEGRLLAYVCAAAAAVPLVVAASATRRAALVTAGGDSEGLAADLGPHARRILLALGAVAVAGVVVQGVVFEGSGWEGLIRGAVEAGGLVAGVVALGRVLGLRA